jgi:hypothetical protein
MLTVFRLSLPVNIHNVGEQQQDIFASFCVQFSASLLSDVRQSIVIFRQCVADLSIMVFLGSGFHFPSLSALNQRPPRQIFIRFFTVPQRGSIISFLLLNFSSSTAFIYHQEYFKIDFKLVVLSKSEVQFAVI